MSMYSGKLILMGSLLGLLFNSCLDIREDPHDYPCTSEYRMLSVSIRDTAGQPVHLDRYLVTKTSTGKTFDYIKLEPYADSIGRVEGRYLLITDAQFGYTTQKGDEFLFQGWLDSARVVNESYILANDRCHVKVVAGDLELVLRSCLPGPGNRQHLIR